MLIQCDNLYEVQGSLNKRMMIEIRALAASGGEGEVEGDGLEGTFWSDGNVLYVDQEEVTWEGQSYSLPPVP